MEACVAVRVACRKGGESVWRECPILLMAREGGLSRMGGVVAEKASVGC